MRIGKVCCMVVTNEKGFERKLRKQLLSYGIESIIAETLAKGFPDLLLIDKEKGKTYFLELKYSTSKDQTTHEKLVDDMQYFWNEKLSHAYIIVFVPGEELFVYTTGTAGIGKLLLITTCLTIPELIFFLRK